MILSPFGKSGFRMKYHIVCALKKWVLSQIAMFDFYLVLSRSVTHHSIPKQSKVIFAEIRVLIPKYPGGCNYFDRVHLHLVCRLIGKSINQSASQCIYRLAATAVRSN